MQFILDCLTNTFGKVDLATHYSSENGIVSNFPETIEASYKTLKANSVRSDPIKNDSLGMHLKTCFENMLETGDKLKVLLIESTNYSMAIKLHIKATIENPVYLICFVILSIAVYKLVC